MTFKQQLKNDALNTFLNFNEFAESVVYTPKGGTAKTIKAVVERQRLNPADETSNRVLINQVQIFIAKDATYGVGSISKDGDLCLVADQPGGIDRSYRVKDILGSDDGIWHLLLQR